MLSTNCTQNPSISSNDLEILQIDENRLSFDIEIGLDNLKAIILNGTKIPLTELTLLDEDLLLEQLNQIEANLPADFATAIEIVNHKQQLISEAEAYACLIVKSAEEKASQILQESEIVRQAELDGARIRLKTERECDDLRQKTQTEIEQLRENAIAECEIIQTGADSYADDVLGDLEQKLQVMLQVVQNGRQQLEQ